MKRTGSPAADATDDYNVIAEMLLDESDRGCAIFSAQILDDHVADLLRSIFQTDGPKKKITQPLFGRYGPVSTFSARLDVAYAIGAMPEEAYRSIQCVRKIRNKMAHERGPISFGDPKIRDLFKVLVDQPNGSNGATFLTEATQISSKSVHVRLPHRLAFALVILYLCGQIDACRLMIQEGAGESSIWDCFVLYAHGIAKRPPLRRSPPASQT